MRTHSMHNETMIVCLLITFSLFVFPAFASVPGTLHNTLDLQEIDGVMVPFQLNMPVPDFEPQDHEIVNLAGEWKKDRQKVSHDLSLSARDEAGIAAIEAEGEGRHLPSYDDSSWGTRTLPGNEGTLPGNETNPPEPYHGGVWYRNVINIPAEWAGKSNRFICLSADYVFDMWINGEWIGVHEGGYTPFALDVSSFLNYGASNLFAIRIDKPFPGLFRQDTVPAWPLMDWWSYTGIIQDIYLESMNPIHVVRTNVVSKNYNGDLEVQIVIANDSPEEKDVVAEIEIFHADTNAPAYLSDPHPSSIIGKKADMHGLTSGILALPAGSVRVLTLYPKVNDPARWTPKEPNLYVLETNISAGNEALDANYTQFGIRTVDRSNGNLRINGRVAFLPGLARHEEWPDTGRTASWDRILEDLRIIQELHALLLRSGHYPNHIYTYLLTDRLGLGVMAEIPIYWFFPWNWHFQEERGIAQQMFREMVFSNYNRPSVILWGTNNESFFLGLSDIKHFNKTIWTDLNTNYPDGRLLTQSSAAGSTWSFIAPSEDPLDVAGWTMYYGVFYDEDNLYGGTMDFLQKHHAKYPDFPLVATEYGYWSQADDSESAKQLQVFVDTWKVFSDAGNLDADGNLNPNGYMAGATWFCVFNWFTKNGLPNFVAPFLESMGLLHMDRTTWKDAAYTLSEAYRPYFEFGGLGPVPSDYEDDDESDDDSGIGNDEADDDTGFDDDSASGPLPDIGNDHNKDICCG